MNYLITESQRKRLFEEEQKVLHIPDIKMFGGEWSILQKYLESKGNPPYSIGGNVILLDSDSDIKFLENLILVDGSLNLNGSRIKSLGNLTSVGGNLYLRNTPIESLGNLTSVGGNLYLGTSSIESFGNLISVGGYLDLENTPISEKYSEEEIRQMVDVVGDIYL